MLEKSNNPNTEPRGTPVFSVWLIEIDMLLPTNQVVVEQALSKAGNIIMVEFRLQYVDQGCQKLEVSLNKYPCYLSNKVASKI